VEEADWVVELDDVDVVDDDAPGGATGNAVAAAPWPDKAFVGKTCRSNQRNLVRKVFTGAICKFVTNSGRCAYELSGGLEHVEHGYGRGIYRATDFHISQCLDG
jgi:hypothetical protein